MHSLMPTLGPSPPSSMRRTKAALSSASGITCGSAMAQPPVLAGVLRLNDIILCDAALLPRDGARLRYRSSRRHTPQALGKVVDKGAHLGRNEPEPGIDGED